LQLIAGDAHLGDLGACLIVHPEQDDATGLSNHIERVRQLGTDRIDDDICPEPGSGVPDGCGQVLLAGVDNTVGAQRGGELAAFLGGLDRDHLAASQFEQGRVELADRSPTEDCHSFTWKDLGQLRTVDHCGQRFGERGDVVGHMVADREALAGRYDDMRCEATVDEDAVGGEVLAVIAKPTAA
jgi:hypothetical protein